MVQFESVHVRSEFDSAETTCKSRPEEFGSHYVKSIWHDDPTQSALGFGPLPIVSHLLNIGKIKKARMENGRTRKIVI